MVNMNQNQLIRSEIPSDYKAITLVNNLAFGRTNEGELVSALRYLTDFNPKLSLVAVKGKDIIGHLLFFPIAILAEQETFLSLSLGPIAVHPDHQNRGVGGQLITQGHQNAMELGYSSVILLGHPSYYTRFGYRMATIWGLTNPWGIHNEAFMAVELVEGSLDGKSGMAKYPEAYNQAT